MKNECPICGASKRNEPDFDITPPEIDVIYHHKRMKKSEFDKLTKWDRFLIYIGVK